MKGKDVASFLLINNPAACCWVVYSTLAVPDEDLSEQMGSVTLVFGADDPRGEILRNGFSGKPDIKEFPVISVHGEDDLRLQ